MTNKLYVGNIPFEASRWDVKELLSQFGEIEHLYYALDKFTGRPRGFAFVTFVNAQDAMNATEQLDGTEFGSRNLRVNPAVEREDREGGYADHEDDQGGGFRGDQGGGFRKGGQGGGFRGGQGGGGFRGNQGGGGGFRGNQGGGGFRGGQGGGGGFRGNQGGGGGFRGNQGGGGFRGNQGGGGGFRGNQGGGGFRGRPRQDGDEGRARRTEFSSDRPYQMEGASVDED